MHADDWNEDPPARSNMTAQIQLASLLGRSSARTLRLTADTVEIRLPLWRRKHVMRVPLAEVRGVGRRIDFGGDETVLHRPPINPSVATGSNLERPNFAIVFRTPQRIPPLIFGNGTYVGLSSRRSKSAEGVHVDGFQLKARDPDAAIAAFAARGIVTADNVAGAVMQTTGVEVDHETASSRRREMDVASRKIWFSLLVGLAGVVCLFASRFFVDDDSLVFWALLAGGGTLFAISAVLTRWSTNAVRRGAPTTPAADESG